MRIKITAVIFIALAAIGSMTCAQSQTGPTPHARVEAVLRALSSGDTAAFEAAAQANMSPPALARRTPQDRANLVTRLQGDFGHFAPAEISSDGLHATIHAVGGLVGAFTFTFEPTADHRIASLSMSVEMGQAAAGGEAEPPAPAPPPVNNGMSPAALTAAVDAWIAPMVAHDDFAGVVLIAHEGHPLVERAYGLANREQHVQARPDTPYNIASIGKKLTQTAIARLIQDGRLSLTDTVGRLIPDYPNAITRGATIDQLIRMQGGVADFFGPAFAATPKSQLTSNHRYYALVTSLPPHFAPGVRTEYCNGCYIVLGEIIERVSGMPFEEYVRRNVLVPAGMTHTSYSRTTAPHTAASYSRHDSPGGAWQNVTNQHGVGGSGAGGLYSTPGDLLAFDNALRAEHLLNARMTAWVLDEAPGGSIPHTGALAVAGGAPGTNAILDSNGRWAVIIVSNVDPPLARQAGEELARALQ